MSIRIAAVSVLFGSSALAGPPAVPLIAHDPYFSAWSMSARLTDDWPRHWSGGILGMSGLVWVDGKAWRWCGPMPGNVPAAEQRGVEVGVDTTTYTFAANGVELTVRFCSPMGVAEDMVQVSGSVSSVTFSARATDGAAHDTRVYLDLTGEWCTNSSDDVVNWSRHRVTGLEVLSMGKADQPVLAHSGDRRKIDWGRVYLAGAADGSTHAAVGGHERSRGRFVSSGTALESDDLRPRAASDDWPVLAMSVDLGRVGSAAGAARHLLVGYDEGRAIELHERPLRPLWAATKGEDFGAQLVAAHERLTVSEGAAGRDEAAQGRFLKEAAEVGGEGYARLVTLAFRQVLAGHKIVGDWDGTPLMFAKENTSNGCIATVDVIYPACPFFLYHNPAMLKAQLLPLLRYAASPKWKFHFAPHDLGTYPKADGQVYGGGEENEADQMPVEESGNMLIMLAALAKVEGHADFSAPYLPQLEAWAGYLREHGLDPVSQLCTDDFAGHLARNANLSAKASVALGAYAQLLAAAGKREDAVRWRAVAEEFASRWQTLAHGEHATVLAFRDAGGPETWSQKYNLAWDRALALNLFPAEVFDREMAWYRAHLLKYGLPLDSRKTYTKLDWTVWSACLTRRREDFDAVLAPVYAWSEASPPPSRVPLSDWYECTDGRTMGMYARTVVGGVWMPLLMKKLGVGWR